MKTIGIVITLLTLLATGCGTTDVADRYYLSRHYPARDPQTVQLLWHKPDRPFTVMADFQSRDESPEDVRKRAAEIGADAVIIAEIGGDYAKGTTWADIDMQTPSEAKKNTSYSHITGTAIIYDN